MDNSMLLGLQAQRVLQRRLEISASNMANVTTTGFKADSLVLAEYARDPARSDDQPNDIRFVRDIGVARDMRQGEIRLTGNTFDLAIEGDGFFTVQGAAGPVYTRDGAFTLNGSGQLVTSDGRPVLSQGGTPLVFDPQGDQPTIGRDGTVRLAGTDVGRLGVVSFANPAALVKLGDNTWSAGGQASAPADGEVIQGALEDSNVIAVVELTNLIQISRAYESAARIVRGADELRQRALDRLGRA
ncbi:MAG: flagellar basal-body rod protein FlgF [Caulobacterales bacterium]|jgi:flagellar basal-body rod protein FlgF